MIRECELWSAKIMQSPAGYEKGGANKLSMSDLKKLNIQIVSLSFNNFFNVS